MSPPTTDDTLPGPVSAAVVVAHPDDEILWCGGFILSNPDWHWRIVTLCRAGDADRAPRFRSVLEQLGAEGEMADLDDGPEQAPLDAELVTETVRQLLPDRCFDLVFTHGPRGEYTRHRRHEESCRAVIELWEEGRITADQLWIFSFEDGGRAFLPRVSEDANRRLSLTEKTWIQKHRLITQTYGFAPDSWEARATPREEGFRSFQSPRTAAEYLESHTPPP